MSDKLLNTLILAFRDDLKAMARGTYQPPRPHPNLGALDTLDLLIDDRLKIAGHNKLAA